MDDMYIVNKLNYLGSRVPIKIDLQPKNDDLKEGLCLGVCEKREDKFNNFIVNTLLTLDDAYELHSYLCRYIIEVNKQIINELNG
ncbi:MAG: hypothetical protein ACRCX2_19415 [Paraclostridium sp.]